MTKISQLPASTVLLPSGLVHVDEAGVSKSIAISQVGGMVPRSAPVGGGTVLSYLDRGSLFAPTAGATWTITAAASLGAGWFIYIRNDSNTGNLILDPNGAETINGFATMYMNPGDATILTCDGVNFSAMFVRSVTGWTPVQGTWTYASATTINVPNGPDYQKGDRIRLTQTTVKYFYCIGVAANVITITGGSDYTLVNAAISLVSISREASPLGFPNTFNYVPTFGGFSVAPTTDFARFSILGNNISVWYHMNVSGTSNSTLFNIALPVPTVGGATFAGLASPIGLDNSANISIPQIDVGGGNVILYKVIGTAASWTAAANKGVYGFNVTYQY